MKHLKKTLNVIKLSIFFGATVFGISEFLVFFGVVNQSVISSSGLFGAMMLSITSIFSAILYTVIKYKWFPEMQHVIVSQYARRMSYAPLYLAEKKGIFTNNGLKVEFQDTGDDLATWEHVKSGEALLGVGDPLIFLRDERNTNGKLIAGIVKKVALWGVTMKKIPPLESLSELSGKTIGVYSPPSTSERVIEHLKQQHLIRDCNVVHINTNNELKMIDSEALDIVFLTEPHVTIAKQQGAHVVVSLPSILDDFLMSGIFSTKSICTKNKDVIERFKKSISESLRYINDAKVSSLGELLEVFDEFDEITSAKALLRLLEERVFPESAEIAPEAWQNYVSACFGEDEITHSISRYIFR